MKRNNLTINKLSVRVANYTFTTNNTAFSAIFFCVCHKNIFYSVDQSNVFPQSDAARRFSQTESARTF